jgi:hypothetical protein
MSRTIVHIDGFNLYYRALRGTSHKWLNVAALAQAVLPATCKIIGLNYYTADISGRTDPTAPARQGAYQRALETLPGVTIHKGRFLANKKWAGLVQPPDFQPPFALPAGTALDVAYVWKTEEKGSDVNLGVRLVRDAFLDRFDEAAVLTNDTDLEEAIRIVRADVGLPVTLLTPEGRASTSLQRVATSTRHIAPYIGPCQLPDPVLRPGKRPISKPAAW